MKRLLLRRCLSAPSLLLLCSLGLNAQTDAGPNVIGTGSVLAGNAHLQLFGTLGQSVTGWTPGTEYHVWQGFWTPSPKSSDLSALPVAGDDEHFSFSLDCLPNPVASNAVVRITMPRRERVRLTLHDMAGRLLATLVAGEMEEGTSTVELNTAGLDNGSYRLVLTADGGDRTLPLHVVR